MQTLLQQLHDVGVGLTDFDADVRLTETDLNRGAETSRVGRVLYHRPGESAAEVRVAFETRDEGKGPKPYRKEYLLDGPWLTERDYGKKVQTRTQVLRPGQKMDLLKLGEGPFPLPIGQEPAEVRRQFDVSLADHKLILTPKPATKLASKFKEIKVSVDSFSHFPTSIETTDTNETHTHLTQMSNLRINPRPSLGNGDFALPTIGDDWELHEVPLMEG